MSKKTRKNKIPERSTSEKVNHYKGQARTTKKRITSLEKRIQSLERKLDKIKYLFEEKPEKKEKSFREDFLKKWRNNKEENEQE